MFWKNTKKMKTDKQLCRLSSLLDNLLESNSDLPTEGVEAVICEDGVVVFNINAKGSEIFMVKNIRKADFSLNLTEEEMQEFNGGASSVRYFPHKE